MPILLALSSNIYANNFFDIYIAVEKLCKAPTDEKTTHYKLELNGDANFRVTMVGLLKSDASFTAEEWDGVQRVLREHQAEDNKDYRDCSEKLTPLFLEKFIFESNDSENNKNNEIAPNVENQTNINGGDISIGIVQTGNDNTVVTKPPEEEDQDKK